MKQKQLTDEQRDVLKRLEVIFKEAEEKKIGFVYDREDGSLSAYNNNGIVCTYAGRNKEEESDEYLDWDNCSIVTYIDYFDSLDQCYLLKF